MNVLYFCMKTFRSMCSVTSIAVFCSYLMSRFQGMLFRNSLNDTALVPVAPIITGITFVFTFHRRCASFVRP